MTKATVAARVQRSNLNTMLHKDGRDQRGQITTTVDGTTWKPSVSFQNSGATNDIQIFNLTDSTFRAWAAEVGTVRDEAGLPSE